MKIAAICDNDTAIGLRLAGMHECFVPEKDSLLVFDEITKRGDIGVLFITEKIAQQIGKQLKDFRLKHDLPIIIEIPDKKGHPEGHVDFISYLIKRAVGIDLSKKNM
ncbi:MAG: V-type ATP synthase subunit F [Candidatus Thermoplasmatota archaeon]|jgi:V/A-type H+-transporting ATPase subunit F|nr:V-type ATP synthase subunit F [Candidatus Thermoplasmatota archaeon]